MVTIVLPLSLFLKQRRRNKLMLRILSKASNSPLNEYAEILVTGLGRSDAENANDQKNKAAILC